MKNTEIVFTAPGTAEVLTAPMSQPDKQQVLLKTIYSVISNGTERANLLGLPNVPGNYPRKLGYCAISNVVACGEEVRDFVPGDTVLVYHGTHSAYTIKNTDELTKVEENVNPLHAAFTVIASMGLGGVRKLNLELGESAMVIGLGLLGLFAVQFLHLSGGFPVIAADPDPERRQIALSIGADYALDPMEEDFADKVRALTHGRGVNATVEVTGVSAAMLEALECAAWMGRIALLGCTRVSDAKVDYYQQVHRPGVTLIGAHNFVRPKLESYPGHWTHQDDCRMILRFIESGKLNIESILHMVARPEAAPEIYTRLTAGNLPVGVVFDWRDIR